MPNHERAEIWHTVPEAARILRCCNSTIYVRARSGELELVKFGRLTRVTDKSLKRYIAQLAKFAPKTKGEGQ